MNNRYQSRNEEEEKKKKRCADSSRIVNRRRNPGVWFVGATLWMGVPSGRPADPDAIALGVGIWTIGFSVMSHSLWVFLTNVQQSVALTLVTRIGNHLPHLSTSSNVPECTYCVQLVAIRDCFFSVRLFAASLWFSLLLSQRLHI